MTPLRSGQPGGRATSRAVAKANGLSGEKSVLHEADLQGDRSCQGFRSCPMAGAGAEELGYARNGAPGVVKAAMVESAAVKVRKVWGSDRMILNVKDRVYNRGTGK